MHDGLMFSSLRQERSSLRIFAEGKTQRAGRVGNPI
jgi:hypothetical protein